MVRQYSTLNSSHHYPRLWNLARATGRFWFIQLAKVQGEDEAPMRNGVLEKTSRLMLEIGENEKDQQEDPGLPKLLSHGVLHDIIGHCNCCCDSTFAPHFVTSLSIRRNPHWHASRLTTICRLSLPTKPSPPISFIPSLMPQSPNNLRHGIFQQQERISLSLSLSTSVTTRDEIQGLMLPS